MAEKLKSKFAIIEVDLVDGEVQPEDCPDFFDTEKEALQAVKEAMEGGISTVALLRVEKIFKSQVSVVELETK